MQISICLLKHLFRHKTSLWYSFISTSLILVNKLDRESHVPTPSFLHMFVSYTWYILYMSKTYLFVHQKDERKQVLSRNGSQTRCLLPLDLLLCRCKNAYLFSQGCCIYERGLRGYHGYMKIRLIASSVVQTKLLKQRQSTGFTG